LRIRVTREILWAEWGLSKPARWGKKGRELFRRYVRPVTRVLKGESTPPLRPWDNRGNTTKETRERAPSMKTAFDAIEEPNHLHREEMKTDELLTWWRIYQLGWGKE